MRRRKNQRSGLVFAAALLTSMLVHALVGIPARSWLNAYLSSGGKEAAPPVRLVRVSPEQWSKNRKFSNRKRKPKATTTQSAKKEQRPKAEKPKPPPETKLKGQIVELPPTADDSPNPDAKYLSKYNTNVKKETVARYEQRDRRKKRVTNKLQEKASQQRPKNAIKNPVLDVKGDDQEADKSGAGKGKNTDKNEFVLELPSLRRRDKVNLRLSDGPGLRQTNRAGREELKGNGKRFRLELGGAGQGDDAGGKKGRPDGADKPAIPSLESLRPTIGTIARISGSPSNDYVENVPEGDGTFLNAKEFKYATFFYRVKDSVGNIWYDMVVRELRRRDPTGNIYGPRDRATLLTVRIDLDGRLASVQVANSSGVQFLDDVAIQAFKMAEPFPNPPSAMADPDGYIKFNFQFVMLRSRGPLNLFNFR